jgi:hypothetical protein
MRLPFMAQVVFSRGQFCPHSADRQCNACFVESMKTFEPVVGDVDAMMERYMRDHRVRTIDAMSTFTVLISGDEPMPTVTR